jgi:hypothetical protein
MMRPKGLEVWLLILALALTGGVFLGSCRPAAVSQGDGGNSGEGPGNQVDVTARSLWVCAGQVLADPVRLARGGRA